MAILGKVSLILIVLLAIQVAQSDGRSSKHLATSNYTKDVDNRTKAAIQYALSGFRGLWHGYNKGFYHNKLAVDPRCFSNRSEAEIYEILHFLQYGEFIDILTIADDVYQLVEDNLQYCNIQKSFEQINNKCLTPNACSFNQILTNCETGMFQIIKTVSDSVDLITHTAVHSEREFYQLMFDLGEDVGELITVAIAL